MQRSTAVNRYKHAVVRATVYQTLATNHGLQFSSSVQYPAMGVALYRWGVMAQSNSSSD